MARPNSSSDSSRPWLNAVTEAGCSSRRGREPALRLQEDRVCGRRHLREGRGAFVVRHCDRTVLRHLFVGNRKRRACARTRRVAPQPVADDARDEPARGGRAADCRFRAMVRRTRARGQPEALPSDVRPSDANISEGLRPIEAPVCRTFDVMRGFDGGAVG